MGKIKDLTGQHFGRLTVIKDTGIRKNRQVVWECQCDCGNIVNVVGGSLRNGHTQSCGCLQKDNAANNNQNNLIGQKFDKLTVIKDSGNRKNRKILWLCQCECGNYVEKTGYDLQHLKNLSCGCKPDIFKWNNYKDLTGFHFGKLTALQPLEERNNAGRVLWLCQCECGNTIKVSSSSLISGNTLSCGCIKSKGEEKINQILRQNNIKFESQKTFDTCRFPDTNALAQFDFYLPDYNILIEYDGEQHFKTKNSGWDTEKQLLYIQRHDNYKNQWCKENNIKIIRIPYTHYNNLNIEDLLEASTYVIN